MSPIGIRTKNPVKIDVNNNAIKGFNLNLMPLSECDYAVFNNMEVIIEYKNN